MIKKILAPVILSVLILGTEGCASHKSHRKTSAESGIYQFEPPDEGLDGVMGFIFDRGHAIASGARRYGIERKTDNLTGRAYMNLGTNGDSSFGKLNLREYNGGIGLFLTFEH